MQLVENIEIALRALRLNALRSMLTMLGIIIGVGSVITMVAVGSGAHERVAAQIRSLGSNLLLVTPHAPMRGGVRLRAGSRNTLTEEDAAAIRREVSSVVVAAPTVSGNAQIVFGNANWATTIGGILPDYLIARDWQLAQGRSFTMEEADTAAKVALIGRSVADALFAGDEPLGQTVRIGRVPFSIVGVLASKGQNASGRDQDDVILVPLSTAKLRLLGDPRQGNRAAISFIMVKLDDADSLAVAEREIRGLLRQRHRLRDGAESDFAIRNMQEVFAAREEATRSLSLLLAIVASVSLLVGGISIMNIMLVSVTERTREIGLRLAVGARRSDIRKQFLVEAMTLCLAGGLIGVLLGVASAVAVARLAGWPILIEWQVVLVSLGFATLVGAFFGLYPAHKASRMDPIEALRFE